MPIDLKLDIYDKSILRILINNKDLDLTTREIAKKVGVNWKTVERHIKKLIDAGLVHKGEKW